jgi:hypothetical protein
VIASIGPSLAFLFLHFLRAQVHPPHVPFAIGLSSSSRSPIATPKSILPPRAKAPKPLDTRVDTKPSKQLPSRLPTWQRTVRRQPLESPNKHQFRCLNTCAAMLLPRPAATRPLLPNNSSEVI